MLERVFLMREQLNISLRSGFKAELERKGINPYEIAKKALEDALGKDRSVMEGIKHEEEQFSQWSQCYERLYTQLRNLLAEREQHIGSEVAKAEETWKHMQVRIATNREMCEQIPEIRELTYVDVFDWQKMFRIIDSYPDLLRGKIGIVQIREYIIQKEVEKGTFKDFQEGREKLKDEIEERNQDVAVSLQDYVKSPEYRKEFYLRLEHVKLESKTR